MTSLDEPPRAWDPGPGTTKAQRSHAGLVVDLADLDLAIEAESDLSLGTITLNDHLSSPEDGRRAPGIQGLRRAEAMNFDVCGSVDLRSQRLESGMAKPISYSDQYNSEMRHRVDLAVWAKSGGRCWYCGKQCSLPPAPLMERMTIDHMTPFKRGGSHGVENLVPACFSCNSIKRNRDVEEYRWALLRMASEVPAFSEKQQAWLASVGFVFERCVGPCVPFWFEREGLAP